MTEAKEATEAVSEEKEETLDREKCIKQPVLTAERNVKYHSNQWKAGQFIAKTVMPRRKDTNF